MIPSSYITLFVFHPSFKLFNNAVKLIILTIYSVKLTISMHFHRSLFGHWWKGNGLWLRHLIDEIELAALVLRLRRLLEYFIATLLLVFEANGLIEGAGQLLYLGILLPIIKFIVIIWANKAWFTIVFEQVLVLDVDSFPRVVWTPCIQVFALIAHIIWDLAIEVLWRRLFNDVRVYAEIFWKVI